VFCGFGYVCFPGFICFGLSDAGLCDFGVLSLVFCVFLDLCVFCFVCCLVCCNSVVGSYCFYVGYM